MAIGPRYEIRAVVRADHEPLCELARFLDSVNLPNDSAAVLDVVAASEDAFSGNIGDPRLRQYVFALWDRQEGRAIGTSMVIGQLGRKDAPYVYLGVITEEKYSPLLDRTDMQVEAPAVQNTSSGTLCRLRDQPRSRVCPLPPSRGSVSGTA